VVAVDSLPGDAIDVGKRLREVGAKPVSKAEVQRGAAAGPFRRHGDTPVEPCPGRRVVLPPPLAHTDHAPARSLRGRQRARSLCFREQAPFCLGQACPEDVPGDLVNALRQALQRESHDVCSSAWDGTRRLRV